MDRTESCNTGNDANLGRNSRLSAILNRIAKKIKDNEKFKIPAILTAAGIGIMLLYPKEKPVPTFSENTTYTVQTQTTVDRQISDILSTVSGAGNVNVMLTVRSDGITEYQTDTEEVHRNGEMVVKSTTVFGGNSADSALVIRKTGVEYLGAVIVADGADSAEVRYNLARAVSSLTGLPINRITVLKMK